MARKNKNRRLLPVVINDYRFDELESLSDRQLKVELQDRYVCDGVSIVQAFDIAHKEMFEGKPQTFYALARMYGERVQHMAYKLVRSKRDKAIKVRDKVAELVERKYKVFFLTFTFRDDVLSKTSPATRRRYVARWCKNHCDGYAANRDYGNDGETYQYCDRTGEIRQSTAREHYHILCVPLNGRIALDTWPYGVAQFEVVPPTKKDIGSTAKYIAKLSSHAMKMMNGNSPRLIYSRNTPLSKLISQSLPW